MATLDVWTPPKVTYRVVNTMADLVRALGYNTNDVAGAWALIEFYRQTEGEPN